MSKIAEDSMHNLRLQTMLGENWKTVPGAEDYLISNFGRIWSLRRRQGLMKPQYKIDRQKNQDRRRQYVQFYGVGKKYSVSRLVARLFIPNPLGLPEVDHINENPKDNRAENLRWTTGEANRAFYAANHPRGAEISERHRV